MLTQSTFKCARRQSTPSATAYCGTLHYELPPMQGDLHILNTRLELAERSLRRFVDNRIAVRVACEEPELVEDMVQGARIAIWKKWQKDPGVAYGTDTTLKTIGKWGAINAAHQMRGKTIKQATQRGQGPRYIRRELADCTSVDDLTGDTLLEQAEHREVQRQGWTRPVENAALNSVFTDWLVDYILECAPTEHQRQNIRALIKHLKDGCTWLEAGRLEGWCPAKAQRVMAFVREKAENATGWNITRDRRGTSGTIHKARAVLAAKRDAARRSGRRGGGAKLAAAVTYPAQ